MFSVIQLAELVNGRIVGDGDRSISGITDLITADETKISFFANNRYLKQFNDSKAGCILVKEELSHQSASLVICEDPYLAMAKVSQKIYAKPEPIPAIDERAIVDESAVIAPSATIMTGAIVMQNAKIG